MLCWKDPKVFGTLHYYGNNQVIQNTYVLEARVSDSNYCRHNATEQVFSASELPESKIQAPTCLMMTRKKICYGEYVLCLTLSVTRV